MNSITVTLACIAMFCTDVGIAQRRGGRGGGRGGAAGGGAGEKEDALGPDGAAIPKPAPFLFPTCRSVSKIGTISETPYDQCISFCCGGEVIEKKESVTCCGSEELGSPYKEGEFACCSWWTGAGKAYRKKLVEDHKYGCCGPHLIEHGSQRCCYGEGVPEPFTYRGNRETCCGSKMVKLTSVFSNPTCCGNSAAYDRKRQSCPCGDGTVLDAREDETACCESPIGRKAPYILKNQFCCNGAVGINGKDFCCGSEVGVIGQDVCCDDAVVTVSPPDKAKTKCCDFKPYNPKKQMCCDGKTKPVVGSKTECCSEVPFNPTTEICCEGSVQNKKRDGSECCGPFAYFPEKKSICCDGVVYSSAAVKGDACCGDKFYRKSAGTSVCCNNQLIKARNKDSCCEETPYNSKTEICCMGNVFDKADGDVCCHMVPYFVLNTTICCDFGPSGYFNRPECCGGTGYDAALGGVCCAGNVFEGFAWPSCCVDTGYDAATHTCCMSTIFPNPFGSTVTGCCGDETSSEVYDRITEMCCDGNIVTMPLDIPRRQATCCGNTAIYNPGTQLCCDGTVHEMESIYFTKCCGISSYDSLTQICCDAEDGTKPTIAKKDKFGATTSCCGNKLFDSKKQYCCDGVLTKAKAGVSACCFGDAYDRSKNICCGGKLHKISAKVPSDKAVCCGDVCMYDGPQFCCEDRIYQGNARAKKTCTNY